MKKDKLTMVIGASDNPERYAYLAAERLLKHEYPIVLVGQKRTSVFGIEILNELKPIENIDTVTLYVGPKNQAFYQDYIAELKPKRVIFNPGTENDDFEGHLQKNGIETLRACTLVMLSTNQF